MKPKHEITNCEYCDEIISLESPPPQKEYELGRIEIHDGTILLSKELRAKNGVNAQNIDGYYCDYHCLYKRIQQILKVQRWQEVAKLAQELVK